MKIEFIGPAVLLSDRSISFHAKLDDHDVDCKFTYEALEDIDPENIFGDPVTHFSRHQLKLLSIAEQKMLNGHAHNGKLVINSNDVALE
jgi:hypothetical protein